MWDGFWCENESGLSEQHMHTHLRTLQNATSVAVSEDQPPQSRPEICAPLIGRTRWHAPDSLQSPSLSVHQAHACREHFDRGGMKRNNYTRTHHSRPNLCIFASVCVATYNVVDGIFKQLCDACRSQVTVESSDSIDLAGRKIWKMSLGNTLGEDAYIYDECIKQASNL